MRDLPGRVHAAVGPPGPDHARRLRRDPRHRRLQRPLHARMRVLPLPADEGRPAVVLDPQRIARHRPAARQGVAGLRAPIARAAARSATPISPTSIAARIAAIASADQICTVWP